MNPVTPQHILVLLRHARAETGLGVADRDRPLAVSGRQGAAEVGASLALRNLTPQEVLVSSAIRTRQTNELVLSGVRGVQNRTPESEDPESTVPQVTYLDELYTAGPEDVLKIVGELSEGTHIALVIGHEPTMAATASLLCERSSGIDGAFLDAEEDLPALSDGQRRLRTGLPVGGYAVIAVNTPWAELSFGGATLVEVVTPARE